MIGKANRIGVKLTGHIHCVAPRAYRPSTERPRRPAIARTDALLWKRVAVPAVPRERKPAWAFGQAQVGEMLKVGLEEIGESALPMADWRPDKRGIRLLRHSDGEGPLLSTVRAGWPTTAEFAGVGRAALRGPQIDGGCLKPRRAGLLARSRMGARARASGSVSRGRDLFVSATAVSRRIGRALEGYRQGIC